MTTLEFVVRKVEVDRTPYGVWVTAETESVRLLGAPEMFPAPPERLCFMAPHAWQPPVGSRLLVSIEKAAVKP